MAPVAGEDVVRTAYGVFRAGATYAARTVGVAGAERLAQKTALMTGGSRGVGAGIVKRSAEDGAHVACTWVRARGKADSVAPAGGRAPAVQADTATSRRRHSAWCDRHGRSDRVSGRDHGAADSCPDTPECRADIAGAVACLSC